MEVANELMIRGIVVGVFQENCWVVGNRRTGEAICIDPGDQPDEILALARDMGVTIKAIANSHAHLDHILGVHGVHEATGAKFLLHESDLDLLQNGWKTSAERMGLDIEHGPPDPDGYVEEDDIVEVDGLRLRVITTPGHTTGSVSYYSEDGHLLFSGDTLFRGSIGRTDMPRRQLRRGADEHHREAAGAAGRDDRAAGPHARDLGGVREGAQPLRAGLAAPPRRRRGPLEPQPAPTRLPGLASAPCARARRACARRGSRRRRGRQAW